MCAYLLRMCALLGTLCLCVCVCELHVMYFKVYIYVCVRVCNVCNICPVCAMFVVGANNKKRKCKWCASKYQSNLGFNRVVRLFPYGLH
jgi:hypothetical protein